MFGSLHKWMNVPITIKPFLKRDGTGGTLYGADIIVKCYPKADAQTVSNNAGIEIKSGSQLYIDGNIQINEQDAVVFEERERMVRAVVAFYRNGIPDIKVAYL